MIKELMTPEIENSPDWKRFVKACKEHAISPFAEPVHPSMHPADLARIQAEAKTRLRLTLMILASKP